LVPRHIFPPNTYSLLLYPATAGNCPRFDGILAINCPGVVAGPTAAAAAST
tara:strand:- start:60 stop:212 length:153 start_codon:yes stop_codon:yes gene_type:complete